MQRKLVVLFCLVLLAFAGLSVRLILINRDNGDSYKKQVLSQQQYSSTTIPYKRGEILDSKGTKLASSEKVYDLVLDIKQMNNKEDYVEPTIQALEDYFSIDGDQVRAYAQEHPDSQYYVTSMSRESGLRKAISEFTRIALSQAMSSALRGRTEPEPTDWKSITTMF